MSLQNTDFKETGKKDFAEFLGITLPTLRMRFEAMEEDGKIEGGWRHVRTLSPGLVRAYCEYYGEPNNIAVLCKRK
jgi:hypothetical protein